MRKNKKGFTLAELLIVLAIVAVLAAIAIPTFGRQLEGAREVADLNNLRAAYADALSEVMLKNVTDATVDATVAVDFTQTKAGWKSVTTPEVADVTVADGVIPATIPGSGNVKFTFALQDNGGYKLTAIAAGT